MRHISYALTTEQVRARTKTVTRRLGWLWLVELFETRNAEPETKHAPILLQPIEKGQGIPKGGHVVRINGPIHVLSARTEPLWKMIRDPDYGKQEAIKEGFPHMDGLEFVEMFIKHHHTRRKPVDRNSCPVRIEFDYLGYWATPRNISSNRYHYFPPGAPSLCGKWQNHEHTEQSIEFRKPASHVDCKACVAIYHETCARA